PARLSNGPAAAASAQSATALLQARARVRAISTTSPAAIRIRKSSEDIPDAPEKPSGNKDAAADETPDKAQAEQTSERTHDAASAPSDPASDESTTKKKAPASASPFGFSSAGSGMASGILGQEGGVEGEAANADEHQQQHQQRDSTTAAEARRARRQRADLPPLEDEPKVKAAKYIGTGLVFGLLIGGAGYYGRPFTKSEVEKGLRDDPEKNALQQLWHRVNKRVGDAFSFLSEPATEKLLPDPNEYSMPYTLVLCLDDMLIHMDWSKEYGWRIAKRPGLDHFLAYMASMFEVVIFSTQPSHSGMLVMERLDPMEYAPYRLYKDHMRNIDGKNYKDLGTINRDMSKVIMVDISEEAFKMQPDNGVLARPFLGEPGDNWIEQITEFLEYIHMMEPKDVRPWIRTYKGMDAAREF
ncbi:mitochondrial inner membrane protein required for protein import, partial [Coemansia sp. RSA 2599]